MARKFTSMRNHMLVLAVLVACSVLAYLGSGSLSAPTLAHHLSINGVRLGMSRTEVDRIFGRTDRVDRGLSEGFGMLPGSCGFGDGTGVMFDSKMYQAHVVEVSGFYLSYDGKYLCGELEGGLNSNSRPEILKRKLGEPDEVVHEKERALWVFKRYQLSIETHPKYAWRFVLGGGQLLPAS